MKIRILPAFPDILAPLVAYACHGKGQPCDLSTLDLPRDLADEIDAGKTPLALAALDLHFAANIRTDIGQNRFEGPFWRSSGVALLLGYGNRDDLYAAARAENAVVVDNETGEHLARPWVLEQLKIAGVIPAYRCDCCASFLVPPRGPISTQGWYGDHFYTWRKGVPTLTYSRCSGCALAYRVAWHDLVPSSSVSDLRQTLGSEPTETQIAAAERALSNLYEHHVSLRRD